MKIKFWGVRGSIPSPQSSNESRKKLKEILKLAKYNCINKDFEIDSFIDSLPFYLKNVYGGNTTCIEINDNEGNIFLLDAGTGIRLAGNDLIKRTNKIKTINLLFTHFHWDHIQGLPFFIPAYLPDYTINFYSTKENFKKILSQQQDFDNFPKKISEMACKKHFIQLQPGKELKIGELTIDLFFLNHPGGCTAFRFKKDNKKIIFTGDVEFLEEDIENLNKFENFFNNADYAIFDSQYTLEESFYKFSWGHTTYTMAVNLAINWNIKNLLLTHFDPSYSDEVISEIEKLAAIHVSDNGMNNTKVMAAYEGLEIEL